MRIYRYMLLSCSIVIQTYSMEQESKASTKHPMETFKHCVQKVCVLESSYKAAMEARQYDQDDQQQERFRQVQLIKEQMSMYNNAIDDFTVKQQNPLRSLLIHLRQNTIGLYYAQQKKQNNRIEELEQKVETQYALAKRLLDGDEELAFKLTVKHLQHTGVLPKRGATKTRYVFYESIPASDNTKQTE